jgi:hypothetical protein
MEAIFAYFFCGIIPRLAAPLAWGLFRWAFVSIRLAQPIETRANRTDTLANPSRQPATARVLLYRRLGSGRGGY